MTGLSKLPSTCLEDGLDVERFSEVLDFSFFLSKLYWKKIQLGRRNCFLFVQTNVFMKIKSPHNILPIW